jgi:signal transduction histidine kinase
VAGSRERPIPYRNRLTVRLTGAVIVALLFIGSPFLVAFHKLQRDRQIDALIEATDRTGRAVVDSLRSAMLAGTPHLLDDVVRGLSDQEGIERTLLLDHSGRLRVSSDPAREGRVVSRERDRTCTVCHQPQSDPPTNHTVVLRIEGQRVLRSVTTIANAPRCHNCHDPAVAINGLLVMDFALRDADSRFLADIGSTVALGAVMVALTIGVLVWLLRRLVHAPLQAVVGTSRRIVDGDLEARADVAGSGEFAELASQMNRMTAHLSRSLRTVETQHRDLEAILDAIDDQVVVIDRERRVVAANKSYRVGSATVAAGAEASSDDGPVGRVFSTGQLHKGIVSQARTDGQEQVIEIHASPLRGADGSVTRCVEVRRDISERRHLEAIAAQSERLASLGLLASGLSHEINNPLGAIAASVEGLRRRLPREPGISADAAATLGMVLTRIGREVERGRVITHRLLKIARPPGNTRSWSDVNHIVKDIVAVLSHDIRQSRITTRLDLCRDLPLLRADEGRLAQVVMNLTLNAIQAMAEGGGELRIATAVENDSIRMEFEDTGCGIPGEQMKKIFEPFFTTKPIGKGTGLGLFITHQILTDLGGTVHVRSQCGAGTTFTVRIPRSGGGDPA